VQQVATGRAHACVRLNRGTVFCWGNNGDGQLGDGTTSPQLMPVMTVDFGAAAQVSLGFQHSTSLRSDGQLFGWGSNRMGQLFEGGSTLPSPMRLAPAAALSVWTGVDTTCIFRMGRPTCVGRQTL
jgi:alpha-tubulin suppressor-like RCC1 family protein